MPVLPWLVILLAPAHAGISLPWAPAIEGALSQVTGPARDVVGNFDAGVFQGLAVRINEIQALSLVGVRDLEGLRALLRSPGAAAAAQGLGVPLEHLAALARSLALLAPVIAELERRGIRVDEAASTSADLAAPLSRALEAASLRADRRARAIAVRYEDPAVDLEQSLADSREADALITDRYPYFSSAVLESFARVYRSDRTRTLAARRTQMESRSLALASLADQSEMRDAVAEPPQHRSWSVLRRAFMFLRPRALR